MRWLVGQGARKSDSNLTSPFLFISSELNPLPTFFDSAVPLGLGHQALLHLQMSYTIYPVGLKSMMLPLKTWFPNEGRKEWSSASLFYMLPRVGHHIWPPEKSALSAARQPSNFAESHLFGEGNLDTSRHWSCPHSTLHSSVSI